MYVCECMGFPNQESALITLSIRSKRFFPTYIYTHLHCEMEMPRVRTKYVRFYSRKEKKPQDFCPFQMRKPTEKKKCLALAEGDKINRMRI